MSSVHSPARVGLPSELQGNATARFVGELLGPTVELNQPELETLCKTALSAAQCRSILAKHESIKASMKGREKKIMDFLSSGVNTMSAIQMRNHALRFGLEEAQAGLLQRQTWALVGAKNSIFGGGNVGDSRDYEDVVSEEVLRAPISEICIIQRGESVPDGFYRISKTPSDKKANLNSGSGGNQIYLCIKKDLTWEAPPITNMVVIFPDKEEFVPPGFFVVRRGKNACNLNTGTSCERIFLCYKKDRMGNPITDIQVIFPGKTEETPKGFSVIEKSPRNIPANLNAGTGGMRIYLCYKQNLRQLVCLTNNESLAPVVKDNGSSPAPKGSGKTGTGIPSLPSTQTSFSAASKTAMLRNRSEPVLDSMNVDSMAPLPAPSHIGSPTQRHSANAFSDGGDAKDAADAAITSAMTNAAAGGAPKHKQGKSMDSSMALSALGSAEESDDEGSPRNSETAGASASEDTLEANADIEITAEEEEIAAMSASEEVAVVVDRRTMAVVDADGNVASAVSRKTLHALLAALYVRHGPIPGIALNALTVMLKETDFFEGDLKGVSMLGTFTMLDLTVEAVCDRLDCYLEAEYENILTFFRLLVKHSGGKLSAVTQQKLFRGLSFLLSTYSSKTGWVLNGQAHPCADNGGDLLALKVFKEMTWATVAQVETVEVAHFLPDALVDDYNYTSSSEAFAIARNFVVEFVEDVIDSVEVSRLTEAAHLTIAKQSLTTTSSSFWMQVWALSRRLFTETALRSAFSQLCALCKLAWFPIRVTENGGPTPRDLGVKLFALEGVLEFCLSAGERMKLSKVMGYQIRRLVIPCLLTNLSYAMVDHRVFAKILRIVSAVWKSWRLHTRIEFANICEQLVIRILQASTFKIRPVFQKIVLEEVVTWFDQPHLLVEMFVNFDMDRKFVSHWEVFSHLVRSVCAIARRISLITGAWDWRPSSYAKDAEAVNSVKSNVTIREVNMQALEEVGRIAKTLMDATGHAHLMMQDERFRMRSLGVGAGWEEDEVDGKCSPLEEVIPLDLNDLDIDSPSTKSEKSTKSTESKSRMKPRNSVARVIQGVKFRRAEHQEAEELLEQAVKIFSESKSLKKAVKFLIQKDFMADSPQEIANFVRVYKNSFDPSSIGDFLGEGGLPNTPEEEYWTKIRFRFVRAVSFVEFDLEPALRLFLTSCGFRLPGEAQKIDRLVEVFVKAFWQDNAGTQYCPFRHPDTVHLVAYALIILNTDLHKATDPKGKKRKKMTKEEFINQLRGADQGHNIDPSYLEKIYESIKSQPIELAVEQSEGGKVDSGENSGQTDSVSVTEERMFVKEVSRAARDSEDLLRALSPFTFSFQITGVDTNISLDLVSFMYETVWFHFHAITDALLSSPNSDIYVTFAALDILCYSLTSSLFLGLKTERNAFATQLYSFQKMCLAQDPSLMAKAGDESWLSLVESTRPDAAMDAIAEVHQFVVRLKDAIQESANYEVTRSVAARIEKKAKVLESNTFFVREGELSKRSRTGRMVSYRFFLFSDQLIYAHQNMSGEYKVHEQLSLSTMNVSDVDDPTGCSLFVGHPTKSFVVVAESKEAKQQWLRDIYQTIVSCRKREAHSLEGRKMSIIGRIEDQQKGQEKRVINLLNVAASSSSHGVSSSSAAADRSTRPASFSNLVKPADLLAALASEEDALQSNGSAGDQLPVSPESAQQTVTRMSPIKETEHETVEAPPAPAPAPSAPLTAEERAAMKEEAIRNFRTRVAALEEKKLHGLFTAGSNFWKGITESRGGGGVSEETKQKLTALIKVAKSGLLSSQCSGKDLTDAATTLQPEAKGPEEPAADSAAVVDAMREFLGCVFEIAPYWKYEQFL